MHGITRVCEHCLRATRSSQERVLQPFPALASGGNSRTAAETAINRVARMRFSFVEGSPSVRGEPGHPRFAGLPQRRQDHPFWVLTLGVKWSILGP